MFSERGMWLVVSVLSERLVSWCFEPSQPHRVTSGLISEKVYIWSYEFSEKGEGGWGGGGSVQGKASKLLSHCPPLCSVVVPLHRQEGPARRYANPSLCPRGSRPVFLHTNYFTPLSENAFGQQKALVAAKRSSKTVQFVLISHCARI